MGRVRSGRVISGYTGTVQCVTRGAVANGGTRLGVHEGAENAGRRGLIAEDGKRGAQTTGDSRFGQGRRGTARVLAVWAYAKYR